MLCPSCGYDNMEGADRCEECLTPLFNRGLPRVESEGLARSVMEDDVSRLDEGHFEIRRQGRVVHRDLTRVDDEIEGLSPSSSDLFENQIGIAVKAALRRKDFANTVTVQIKLVDKVDAR